MRPVSFLTLVLGTLSFALRSASAAREPFNVSVSDQSPTIGYFPSRSGPSQSTWNVTYTDSSWPSYINQTIGQGVSSHYTTYVGANATLGWIGTAIFVWGEAADQDIEVKVDDSTSASKMDGGWSVTGLQEGWHRVRIRVVGNGGVRLHGITFTTGIGQSGATPVNTTVEAIFGQNNMNGFFGSSKGDWETNTQVGGVAGQAAQLYNRLDTSDPGAQLIFQPPSNTSFVLLYGSVNFDHGTFSVVLSTTSGSGAQTSGSNGDGLSTTTTTTTVGTPSNQDFNGDSPWISIDQVVYYALLDPKVQYTVTVQNQGQDRQYWDVAKVVFIQAQGGSSGSASSTAAIAGGVAGGVVALLLLAILLWFFVFRKRRQTKNRKQEPVMFDDKPFEVDPYNHDAQNADMAYANAAAGTHTPLDLDDTTASSSRGDPTMAPLLSHSPGSPGFNSQFSSASWSGDRRDSHNSFGSSAQSPNLNRLSIPSSEFGMAYFTPGSSKHASLQPTYENEPYAGGQSGLGGSGGGMILHNPDHSYYGHDEEGRRSASPYSTPGVGGGAGMGQGMGTGGESAKSRMAGMNVPRNRQSNSGGAGGQGGQGRSSWIQERDAGVSLPPLQSNDEQVVVPPSYDPSWARDRDTDRDGNGPESEAQTLDGESAAVRAEETR